MRRRRIASYALIGLSAIMIFFGVMNGEITDVFNKAIRICLECIGIGRLPW